MAQSRRQMARLAIAMALVALVAPALGCKTYNPKNPACHKPPPPKSPPPPPPPPPSPPPPPAFYQMPHNCQPGNSASAPGTTATPYQVSLTAYDPSTLKVTFTVSYVAPTVANACNTMVLDKIHFLTAKGNAALWGSVLGDSLYVTPAGGVRTKKATSWAWDEFPNGTKVAALKVTALNLQPAQVNGLVIEFQIDKKKATSLEAWAGSAYGGVQYGYFNVDHGCCGTNIASFI